MANLTTPVRFVASVTTGDATGNVVNDGISESFTAKERMVERVYSIPATDSITITKATEGYTTITLVKVEVLTPNKPVQIIPDGDTTGISLKPIGTSSKASICFTGDFTTLEIENPDAAEILVAVSLFEKAA